MWRQVLHWYGQVQKWTKPLNESKLLAGILIVLINISSKLVDVRLSRPMEAYFRHTFSRHALVFAMAWMPTRDIILSMIVSVVAIFIIDHLANDNSPWCALSEQFTGMHLEKEKARLEKERQEKEKDMQQTAPTSNESNQLNKDEIDRAIMVLERLRSIASNAPYTHLPKNTNTTTSSSIRPANNGDSYIW